MEKAASPFDLKNWRFQQGLFRAYYDAYARERLIFERGLETQAMAALEKAGDKRAEIGIAAAERILDQPFTGRTAEELRMRIHELAEALFQSIGMQLSVKKYRAIGVDRGASLDTLEYPLLSKLRDFGVTDYFALALNRTFRLFPVVAWATDRPSGFSDADIAALEEINPALAAIVETRAVRRISNVIIVILLSVAVAYAIVHPT